MAACMIGPGDYWKTEAYSKAVGADCSHMMFIKLIMATPMDIPFARRCVGQISEM